MIPSLASFLPLISLIIAPALFGACPGWLSLRKEAPLCIWTEHPWWVFWATFPFVPIGSVLFLSGFAITGITLMGFTGPPSLLSAIHGLRVSWSRSHSRSLFMLTIVWILLIVNALIKASLQEGDLPVQITYLAGGFLSVPFWVLSAIIAKYVSRRLTERQKKSGSISMS